MKYILFACLFIMSYSSLKAQKQKKIYQIKRAETAPTIDGVLDDAAWKNAQTATNFIEFEPVPGQTHPNNKRTEVKMTYNNDAIYVSAYLYDDTEDIMTQFTQRDDFGQNDFFGLVFNPNNDAQNNTEFFVLSSGAQVDAVESPNNGEDFGWNAVWDSKVSMQPDGWIVEIKIPYQALRFTQQETPTWGIQFHRHFRKTRSQSTWNAIDVTKGSIGLYNAELKGLKNIKPPIRLSFFPYASFVASDFENNTESEFTAGMDLKYGITENITLDATLVPDFSQAGFDNVILNLGPFEQEFDEQRQFFTEGLDLFNKGDLFYTRRVGGQPSGDIVLDDDESIEESVDKVQLLNAIKISGRTKNGLGVGFFNAITKETEVTIVNTTNDNQRKEVVEPLSNYNIMVLDQQFNKNSSVTLINTNVTRDNNFRDANVTGLLLDLINKSNTYGIVTETKVSTFNDTPDFETGYSSLFGFRKNSGRFRFNSTFNFADENYNINDLGILFGNNFKRFNTNFSYQSFKPTRKLNSYFLELGLRYNRIHNPDKYSKFQINANFRATNKKLHSFGANLRVNPGNQFDFFEPRDNFNTAFKTKNYLRQRVWVSSNYNTFFALDANLSYATFLDPSRSFNNTFIRIAPRFKFNEKFLLVLRMEHNERRGDVGYVNGQNIEDVILFGDRERKDIEASISGSYTFNPYHGLELSFRNYQSKVTYDPILSELQDNGDLIKSNIYTKYNADGTDDFSSDANFNTWNLDLGYTWQFAPGSQLTALYRNQIFNFNDSSTESFTDSIDALFNQEQRNTFSLRLVYFIDYVNVKKLFKSGFKTS